jgi:YD repeat-containing protein
MYAYDADGNLMQSTNAEGQTTRIEYKANGLPLAVTDWEGYVTRFKRDDFGRVLSQIDPLGRETKFTYNVLQKLGRAGAWVFRGTRTPVKSVFESLELGESIRDIVNTFDVTEAQIKAVLAFAAKSLETAPAYGHSVR